MKKRQFRYYRNPPTLELLYEEVAIIKKGIFHRARNGVNRKKSRYEYMAIGYRRLMTAWEERDKNAIEKGRSIETELNNCCPTNNYVNLLKTQWQLRTALYLHANKMQIHNKEIRAKTRINELSIPSRREVQTRT